MDPSFLEEIILSALKQADTSLTILEIADMVKIHRVTASKYLSVLEDKGHVQRRDVGKAKLYSISKNSSSEPTIVFNGNGGGKDE